MTCAASFVLSQNSRQPVNGHCGVWSISRRASVRACGGTAWRRSRETRIVVSHERSESRRRDENKCSLASRCGSRPTLGVWSRRCSNQQRAAVRRGGEAKRPRRPGYRLATSRAIPLTSSSPWSRLGACPASAQSVGHCFEGRSHHPRPAVS